MLGEILNLFYFIYFVSFLCWIGVGVWVGLGGGIIVVCNCCKNIIVIRIIS